MRVLDVPNAVRCRIVERVNRFVVTVEMEGRIYRASINNTGRLHQFLVAGRGAFCMKVGRVGRLTDCKLFAIEDGIAAAIIDTQLQMRAFEACIGLAALPWLAGYTLVRRNARLGESVMDYLLERNGERLFLEVKSAVFRDGPYAMYPDCPTARGRRHVLELTRHVQMGGKAAILFIAALPGVTAFKPFESGDPEMLPLLAQAEGQGVMLKSIGMAYQPDGSFADLFAVDLPVRFSSPT